MKPEDFGIDPDSVHLDADSLAGDIRDSVLSHLRSMRVPWGHLNQQEQQDKISAAERLARNLVRNCVIAVAERGFPHVEVIIGKTTIDKGLELKLTAANTLDNVTKICSHGKMGAVLVLAEVATFLGEKGEAKPDPDQPEMPLKDAAE